MGVYLTVSEQEEPTAEQLTEILASLKSLPRHLRGLLKKQMAVLPRSQGAGRRKLLSVQEEQSVRAQIGGLLGSGVDLQDAFRRVARQFKDRRVSTRTIKRTWEARKAAISNA